MPLAVPLPQQKAWDHDTAQCHESATLGTQPSCAMSAAHMNRTQRAAVDPTLRLPQQTLQHGTNLAGFSHNSCRHALVRPYCTTIQPEGDACMSAATLKSFYSSVDSVKPGLQITTGCPLGACLGWI